MRLCPTRAYQQALGLGEGRRLALLGKLSNNLLWHWTVAPGVLTEDHSQRWLDVNDLDASVVVGEQINPSSPGLPQNIRGIDGKRPTRPQVLPASLSSGLDHFALIIGRFNVEFASKFIQRNDGKVGAICRQPGVRAAAGQTRHRSHGATIALEWHVMQVPSLLPVE
jgi:hypothetical protein